jgi:hypothetical protein
VYTIDFCRGLILFNNSELAKIPENSQNSIEFVELFGKSVFEAFHNVQDNSLQIQKSFEVPNHGVSSQIMNKKENEKIEINFSVKKLKCVGGMEKYTMRFVFYG